MRSRLGAFSHATSPTLYYPQPAVQLLTSYPLDPTQLPLASALQASAQGSYAAFHTPGHKRGAGISPQHRALFGAHIFRSDLPELPGLDNLFAPEGAILAAQQLAAEAFGAERTWFLANGSSCGIQAALLATCGPGDQVLVPRNLHSSAIAGLILCGAVPIYLEPDYSQAWDIPVGLPPARVEAALKAYPDAKALLAVSPTYQGICSDLPAIAACCHRHGIPLIVDEAHGPHFAFHPELPPTALSAGADIAIQSAHKVLSAFTQAALLHAQGNRIAPERLRAALSLTQSTSPSYLLLASLDLARHQMATEGFTLMQKTIALADHAWEALDQLPGLQVLQPRWPADNPNQLPGDRTRLTVEVSGLGMSGFEVDQQLHDQHQITAELPTLHHLTLIVSLGNTAADIEQLIQGFTQLTSQGSSLSAKLRAKALPLPANSSASLAPPPMTPREAFFAAKEPKAITQAVGHLCAEVICPYPPGIPLLLPGEIITASALNYLQAVRAAGGVLTGCQDPSLTTVLTVSAG